eukprot:7400953-Pyramimonas_sp.AAC.1
MTRSMLERTMEPEVGVAKSRRNSVASTIGDGEPKQRRASQSSVVSASTKTKLDRHGKVVNLNLITGYVKDEYTMSEADFAE